MSSHDYPTWGEELARLNLGGLPFLAFTTREHMVARLLLYAARWGERDYLVKGSCRISAAATLALVGRRAGDLIAAGLPRGGRVLLLAWNSPDWVIDFWAILWAGGVPVLGNPLWSAAEVAHAFELAEARFALVDDKTATIIPAGLQAMPVGGDLPRGEALDSPVERDEGDEAVVLFTSGTTGLPKAVLLANRGVIAAIHGGLQLTRRLPHQLADDFRGEKVLQTAPLFHVGGLIVILRTAILGGTLIFPDGRFDATETLRIIESERIQSWFAVPTMMTRILDAPELAETDTTSLRSVTLGGSVVHGQLMERVRQAFPSVRRKVNTGWGLTESGTSLTAASGADTNDHPGSVGKPLPFVELRTDAEDGKSEGELLARSPAQMLRYLGAPDDKTIDDEGWLHTGDLGRIDSDGRVWLTGRKKDLIIRGGENIAPAHVERVLLRHPAVADVAVLGVPDYDLGEAVAAVVVLRPGENRQETDLKQFAEQELARFARPTHWRFLSQPLPTNGVGKVDKAALVAGLFGKDDGK